MKTLNTIKNCTDTCKKVELMETTLRKHVLTPVNTSSQQCYGRLQSFLSCKALLFNNLPSKILSCKNKNLNNLAYLATETAHDNVSVIAPQNSINSNLKVGQSPRPYIMGIDPGISGAVAIIRVDGPSPVLLTVFDIPTVRIGISSTKPKGKERIDVLTLAFKIDAFSSLVAVCLIEDVHSMPGDGHVGAFVFGFATGVVHGILNTCLIPTKTVKPAVWKMELGLSSDKDESIKRAIKYLPESQEHLKLKKHHGRAEAILLAFYAWKKMKHA